MADTMHNWTDDQLSALERKIRGVYSRASVEVQKKYTEFLRTKASELKHQEDLLKSGKITQEEFKNWNLRVATAGKGWENLRNSLSDVCMNANSAALSYSNYEAYGIFAQNANFAGYQIEKGLGMNLNFTLQDQFTVKRLVTEDPNLLPLFSIDSKKDKAWNMKKITQEVTQGILQGESIGGMSKRIERVVDMNHNAAIRTARTTTTSAENAGRIDSYSHASDMGIKVRKQWVATLDERTRTSHAELDGTTIDYKKPFSNRCMYPGDPSGPPAEVYNCRCTLIADLPDVEEIDPVTRYSREDDTIKDMTYKQWQDWKKGGPGATVQISPLQACKTAGEVANLLSSTGWLKKASVLDGCDLDSAKSIYSSYEQIFSKYPSLAGKIGGCYSRDLGGTTYAQCYIRSGGRIEVNSNDWAFGNFSNVMNQYERDVLSGWHPQGTTAEGVLSHEFGHAIDGYLSTSGIKGGRNAAGEFVYASSTMRNKIMKACGLTVKDVSREVSRYASKNPQEWFAECFSEYVTSASPRPVAKRFGEELEKILEEV